MNETVMEFLTLHPELCKQILLQFTFHTSYGSQMIWQAILVTEFRFFKS